MFSRWVPICFNIFCWIIVFYKFTLYYRANVKDGLKSSHAEGECILHIPLVYRKTVRWIVYSWTYLQHIVVRNNFLSNIEENILQRYVYTQAMHQNSDIFQDLSKMLDWSCGWWEVCKVQWVTLTHGLSMLSTVMQRTCKVNQLNSHNIPLQITHVMEPLVSDILKTLIAKSAQAVVGLIKL